MKVITCIAQLHDPWLLGLAAIFCAFGAWVTVGLLDRYAKADKRVGPWLFLAGTSAGATTWCTHFIAMLAFDPTGAAVFETGPTVISLALACLGATVAFMIGFGSRSVPRLIASGAGFGLSVSAMHYTGMAGFVYAGVMAWDVSYIAASVAFSVVLGAITMVVLSRGRLLAAAVLMVLTIVSLHFTGMGAIDIVEVAEAAQASNFTLVGIAIAAVGCCVIGSSLAASLLDTRNLRETAKSMERMALTDTLTMLPNRSHFSSRLEEALKIADRDGSRVLVLGIDLDHFKEINDLRGHAAGDRALEEVAERMSKVLEDGEFLARLGGDEFAAFKILSGDEDPATMAQRLREAIIPPINLPDGGEAVVDGCFGATLYPADGSDPETLISNADLAMYRAKSLPTEYLVFYAPEMDEAVRARRQLVADLRLALSQNQFEVHYQVQEAVATHEVTGYEALLRWKHPERGYISPAEFIPAAEDTGLILPIGEWVMRQACMEAARYPEMGRVAVNMSAVQFSHPDLPGLIRKVLSDTGLEPARLEIELTESTLMEEPERNLAILRQIQEIGVSVAMDDFGTGYSSLSTLRSFRFDKIKLDRSFMSEVETDPQSKAIIRAVLALGNSLHIPVLAEGVETQDQLTFLREEGCTEAQGYLLGRPSRFKPRSALEAA